MLKGIDPVTGLVDKRMGFVAGTKHLLSINGGKETVAELTFDEGMELEVGDRVLLRADHEGARAEIIHPNGEIEKRKVSIRWQ
jgi:hypothetical protein